MPEGPEIESMRRGLISLEGAKIKHVRVQKEVGKKYLGQPEADRFKGAKVLKLQRRGKRLRIKTDQGSLVVGAGMSGHWRWERSKTMDSPFQKHAMFIIESSAGTVVFYDARRFGSARYFPKKDKTWDADIGLEGLDRKVMTGKGAGKRIAAQFARLKTRELKVALLDQSRVASIGNIYASEICFRLGVDPKTKITDFTQWKQLGRVTYDVLRGAVLGQGTRIKGANAYRTPHDEKVNGFQLMVYGRTGKPCRVCKTMIESFDQNGRTSYWCRTCQGGE